MRSGDKLWDVFWASLAVVVAAGLFASAWADRAQSQEDGKTRRACIEAGKVVASEQVNSEKTEVVCR